MTIDPSTSAEPPPQQQQHHNGEGGATGPDAVEQQQPPSKPPKSNDQSAVFLRAARAGNIDQVLEFLRAGIDINTCNTNGLNALHLASKEGHNEVVRELLRRGGAVDASTRKGNTALHIASLAGQDIVVTILVEHGANVNAQSLNGFTPLYMAAQENHELVVRYLLAHGANQALSTEDGFTPLAVALQQGHDRIVALLLENDNTSKVKLPALHIAAKKDDTRAATLLLQNEQNPNVTSKSGFTPLHIAAHYGNEGIAQLLIDKGANVNFQARHNISPLHVAAKWGRVKLVELLLDRAAIIDCRTRDLLTPLHCAARSGHDGVVELLLERGAPIAAKTKNGLAPVHMAAQGDHVDCARILLFHRAAVDEVTVDYLTPLHVAAHCGHVAVAKLLLDRQADPNARALNGFTPLHIACKKNRIKVVELLLKYHASVEATTESGLAPLHVAAFMGCISIVIFLLQQGANVDCETVRGETPLHLAARANQTDIVRVLVRNKANVDAQARELQTPLHIAARLGNADIVMILLSAHANPNAATRDQYTPLHIAAKEGQEEVVQLLLEKKANKTLLTKKGFSPLHLAAKYGNYAVVRLLLDRGTPVDIEGKNQVTPLHVAAHYNNERVAQLLLERGARAQACAKNGYTPLHIAAKKSQMEIAHALLAYRANPNAESRAGFTPLHLAAEEGHLQMAALLIENGSQVNARAKNGLTPMHLCAQEDRVDVADHLFASGADVNAQTNAGYTPLHVACHFGQMQMVRWLVEHSADVNAETRANYTPLHQAAQQGHNHVVQLLLQHGASPNTKTATGQTPLAIAQRLGYVSVVETLRTVTETTVITETTTVTEERYRPHNPEAMNETMFSDSEDEADDHAAAAAEHARDFNESITQGLRDSAVIHLIHTGEQQLTKSGTQPFDSSDADLEAVIKRAQNTPITTAMPDSSFLDNGHDDNVALSRHDLIQPSFLISFLVDARGGAMRGCRHSGVRVIIPPRKAAAPTRVTCRYLKREKLTHPPPLSEGEALASRILEMGPHGAKFLGPVILEVPHFASLRGREREVVILRSDDGQHWKEHQLEATEDAVQEVLNESFDQQELQQLDELHTSRITRILTSDFPMYFAVVTRVRQEVHCVGPEGGVILSSVVPRVQAIFPDGSLTKTIKVSLQAQPVPQELVTKLHGNRVAVSPIVTVEPRRRKFHKPITLCIPLPQSTQKGMLTQYPQAAAQPPEKEKETTSGKKDKDHHKDKDKEKEKEPPPQQEPPTLRLLCSITGGSAPAQWEDITGTTQLTFAGDEISFTTTVSARFWLMDCQTPRDAARMAQEVYNEAIAVPFMAKFVVFARRAMPVEGQLRMFCMTDDKEDKTLEKQEGFHEIAKSRDVEVLSSRHQWLEFAGNLMPVTKRGDQLSLFFLPFQENRLAFNIKVRQQDDQEAGSAGKVAVMREPRSRADTLPPQHPICTLSLTLPDYTGPLPSVAEQQLVKRRDAPIAERYAEALQCNAAEAYPHLPLELVSRRIGGDWARLSRALGLHPEDTRQIRKEFNTGMGHEAMAVLKIWVYLKGVQDTTVADLEQALQKIGRDDIVQQMSAPSGENGFGGGWEDAWPASRGGTPSLRRNHSSKGSLAATGPVAAAAISTTATPPPIRTTMGISPALPVETAADVETVVTRTERYVHHAQDTGFPVVDERITEQVFRDGEEVKRREIERQGLPLNEHEQQQWDTMAAAEPEEVAAEQWDQLARSREAQIVDSGAHTEVLMDAQGRPIEQTTVRQTTLVHSHVVPGEQEPEQAEQEQQREPSQGSGGSVVIHEEEEEEEMPSPEQQAHELHMHPAPQIHFEAAQAAREQSEEHYPLEREQPQFEQQPQFALEREASAPQEGDDGREEEQLIQWEQIEEEEEQPASPESAPADQEQRLQDSQTVTTTTTTTSTLMASSASGGTEGYEPDEAEEEEEQEGAQPFEPAKQDGQKAEEEEKVEEWARRGPPVVQQQESVEEGLAPAGDGSIVAKKRAHTLMTSQSQVQGLDEHGQPPKTTATTTSPSSSRPQSGIPILPRGEDGRPLSPSSSASTTTSSTPASSVRDRIAHFEALRATSPEEEAAKKRFGWRPAVGGSTVPSERTKEADVEARAGEEAGGTESPQRVQPPSADAEQEMEQDKFASQPTTVAQAQPTLVPHIALHEASPRGDATAVEADAHLPLEETHLDIEMVREQVPAEEEGQLEMTLGSGGTQPQHGLYGGQTLMRVEPLIVIEPPSNAGSRRASQLSNFDEEQQQSPSEEQPTAPVQVEQDEDKYLPFGAETSGRVMEVEPKHQIQEQFGAEHEELREEQQQQQRHEKLAEEAPEREEDEFGVERDERIEHEEAQKYEGEQQQQPREALITQEPMEEPKMEVRHEATAEAMPFGQTGADEEEAKEATKRVQPDVVDVVEEHVQIRRISMDTGGEQQAPLLEQVERETRPSLYVTTGLERSGEEVAPSESVELSQQREEVVQPTPTPRRFQPAADSFVTDSDGEVQLDEEEQTEHQLEQLRHEGPSPAERLGQIEAEMRREAEAAEPQKVPESVVTSVPEAEHELQQTPTEHTSHVWLGPVPVEQAPYEAEQVAQAQALLWAPQEEPEEREATKLKSQRQGAAFAAAALPIAVMAAAAGESIVYSSERTERDLELEDGLAMDQQQEEPSADQPDDDLMFHAEQVMEQLAETEPRPKRDLREPCAGWPQLEPVAVEPEWRSPVDEQKLLLLEAEAEPAEAQQVPPPQLDDDESSEEADQIEQCGAAAAEAATLEREESVESVHKHLVQQEPLPGALLVEEGEADEGEGPAADQGFVRRVSSVEQPSVVVTETRVNQIVNLAQVAEECAAPKQRRVAPPLSPLHSEEALLSTTDESEDGSSVHTIIHRPELLVEGVDEEEEDVPTAVECAAEARRTRSLYGAVTPDLEEMAAGKEDSHTPPTPMSAARWKSLDERSSTTVESPSPLIEVTPAPEEEENALLVDSEPVHGDEEPVPLHFDESPRTKSPAEQHYPDQQVHKYEGPEEEEEPEAEGAFDDFEVVQMPTEGGAEEEQKQLLIPGDEAEEEQEERLERLEEQQQQQPLIVISESELSPAGDLPDDQKPCEEEVLVESEPVVRHPEEAQMPRDEVQLRAEEREEQDEDQLVDSEPIDAHEPIIYPEAIGHWESQPGEEGPLSPASSVELLSGDRQMGHDEGQVWHPDSELVASGPVEHEQRETFLMHTREDESPGHEQQDFVGQQAAEAVQMEHHIELEGPSVGHPEHRELVESAPVEHESRETFTVQTKRAESPEAERHEHEPAGDEQLVESEQVESVPFESKLVENVSIETGPVESEPIESGLVENVTVENVSIETGPVESEPIESGLVESAPVVEYRDTTMDYEPFGGKRGRGVEEEHIDLRHEGAAEFPKSEYQEHFGDGKMGGEDEASAKALAEHEEDKVEHPKSELVASEPVGHEERETLLVHTREAHSPGHEQHFVGQISQRPVDEEGTSQQTEAKGTTVDELLPPEDIRTEQERRDSEALVHFEPTQMMMHHAVGHPDTVHAASTPMEHDARETYQVHRQRAQTLPTATDEVPSEPVPPTSDSAGATAAEHALALGLVTERQAQQLVEEALDKVFTEGALTPGRETSTTVAEAERPISAANILVEGLVPPEQVVEEEEELGREEGPRHPRATPRFDEVLAKEDGAAVEAEAEEEDWEMVERVPQEPEADAERAEAEEAHPPPPQLEEHVHHAEQHFECRGESGSGSKASEEVESSAPSEHPDEPGASSSRASAHPEEPIHADSSPFEPMPSHRALDAAKAVSSLRFSMGGDSLDAESPFGRREDEDEDEPELVNLQYDEEEQEEPSNDEEGDEEEAPTAELAQIVPNTSFTDAPQPPHGHHHLGIEPIFRRPKSPIPPPAAPTPPINLIPPQFQPVRREEEQVAEEIGERKEPDEEHLEEKEKRPGEEKAEEEWQRMSEKVDEEDVHKRQEAEVEEEETLQDEKLRKEEEEQKEEFEEENQLKQREEQKEELRERHEEQKDEEEKFGEERHIQHDEGKELEVEDEELQEEQPQRHDEERKEELKEEGAEIRHDEEPSDELKEERAERRHDEGQKDEEQEEEEEMMLIHGHSPAPMDVLDVGPEDEEEEEARRKRHMLEAEAQREEEEERLEAAAALEAADSSADSLGSSPAKRRRSSANSGGVAGGNGSAEGSLLEFERLERELGTGQEQPSPRSEKAAADVAAAIAGARESAESISGSVSSLNEFEQLEKEIRETVGVVPGDEAAAIMVLSDIREESDEGALEEDSSALKGEDEEEDEERMSTREDEEDEEAGAQEELLAAQHASEMAMLSSADSLELKPTAAAEGPEHVGMAEEKVTEHAAMLSSVDSLESPRRLAEAQQQQQRMETSVDSLEQRLHEEESEERDSLSEEVELQTPEHRQITQKDNVHTSDATVVGTGTGNGNGSPDVESDGSSERTIFATTTGDGSAHIVRTVTTRVRDPVHSRVRFVDTEDEQRVHALLTGESGDAAAVGEEHELVDDQGNVSRVRTVVERVATPPQRI